jgi:hypothetical protein
VHVPSSLPALSFAPRQADLLHRLAHALETAHEACRCGTLVEKEWALSEGLAVIGSLYGSLDSVRSPEASTHLESVCDTCLEALADAYAGRPEALSAATAFVHAMCSPFVALAARPSMAA